jgi:two-component system, OmpR family, response regulator
MTPKRILIVEDDQDLRYLWAETLRNSGHEVLSVEDGTLALAELPGFRPDLILLDLLMPRAKLDGVGLLSRLSADATLTRPPVLVISGLGDPLGTKMTPETASSFGIVGIVSKPVAIDALAKQVDRALRSTVAS